MELAIEDGIEKKKAKLNEEWYGLVHEEAYRIREMYEQLRKIGWRPQGLEGPTPPEVQAIEDEFKPKYDDVMRRYNELVKGTKQHDEH